MEQMSRSHKIKEAQGQTAVREAHEAGMWLSGLMVSSLPSRTHKSPAKTQVRPSC